MRSFLLFTVVCIAAFAVCEPAAMTFGKTTGKSKAPPNKCPLSKTVNNARVLCLTQPSTKEVEGGSNIVENFGKDLAALANDMDNDEAMEAFVEKYQDLLLCIIKSTGLIKMKADGSAAMDPTRVPYLLQDAATLDPNILSDIEKELEPCVEEGKDEGEMILCAMDGINRACGYGFLSNLAAPPEPVF